MSNYVPNGYAGEQTQPMARYEEELPMTPPPPEASPVVLPSQIISPNTDVLRPSVNQFVITIADPADPDTVILYGPCICGRATHRSENARVPGQTISLDTPLRELVAHHLDHLDRAHNLRPVMKCGATVDGNPNLRCVLNEHTTGINHRFEWAESRS